MTVTPGPAPARIAGLTAGAYTAAMLGWLLLPWDAGTGSAGAVAVLAGLDVTRILVAVVALTALGLWRRGGLATPPGGRALLPALPLAVPVVLPLLFGGGIAHHSPGAYALGALTLVCVAVGEEAVFRGAVLRTLLPYGMRGAVAGSAVLFGLMHLVNLAAGNRPLDVAAQVVMATGMGVAYAAVALATGTLWWLVAVHFAMDYVNAVQAAVPAVVHPAVVHPAVVHAAASGAGDDLLTAGVNVALGILFAAYGGWLLRRRHGLIRDLEGAAQPSRP